MTKPTRRSFLKTAAVIGGAISSTGYFVAESNAQESSSKKLNVACIGVGGKGGSDSDNAAKFGNIVAICDVDRSRLDAKSKKDGFQTAKKYTDYRKMLEENDKDIDIVTVSGPDHMHAAALLKAMRMGKHCFGQKPLTRSIYEARLVAQVAKKMGVCTQMGNQGTALDTSRACIAQLKAGIIGTIKEVIVWSDRPVWPQSVGRRDNMESFAKKGYAEAPDRQAADRMIWKKYDEVNRDLQNLDWQNWLSTAQYRDFFPGLYHSFAWRGWWDFGTGALGDMACHMLTVPFVAAGLKDPTWVRARTTGHDFDTYPESSIIEFEFPANAERGKIPFWWYDRKGNRPPQSIFDEYGVKNPNQAGVLIIGDKGALYSPSDYCESGDFLTKGGKKIEESPKYTVKLADETTKTDKANFDEVNMRELFRAIEANDPSIAQSNFVDRAGPLTETILLGNLAVWAAPEGGAEGAFGDWGEKIEWDAKNLVVTNLSSLKTPGVSDLVKPVYTDGHQLD